MKKTIFILMLAVTFSTVYSSCDNAGAVKSNTPNKIVPDNYLQSLKEAGFKNIPEIKGKENDLLRQKYMAEFGLNFIAENELRELQILNNIYKGSSDRYIKEIPQEAILTFNKNYEIGKKIFTPDYTYLAPDGKTWSEKEVKKMNAEDQRYVRGLVGQVFIVAPFDSFNADGELMNENRFDIITKPKDPIIIMQTNDGYVELARWK